MKMQRSIPMMLALSASAALAQNPSPPLPPQTQLPALSPAPTERSYPAEPSASDTRNDALRAPDVAPLAPRAATPDAPAPQINAAARNSTLPERDNAHGLGLSFFNLLGPFHRPTVPPLFAGNATRLESLIRDGKLYLTLEDAIDLAIENNLDVETERYNLVLANTDEVRAKGGGNLRGIDYTLQEAPNGVGGPGSPLLNAATTNPNPQTPVVTDLTSLNSLTQSTQSLSMLTSGFTYAPGPNIPLFDPQVIGTAGWLRRENTVTLTATGTGTGTGAGTGTNGGTTTQTGALDFTALNLAYLEGFHWGGQITAIANNDATVIYGSQSRLDPFYSPSTSVSYIQPLLRGFGRDVNTRFIRIAQTNRKVSRLLFEQQVMDTVYGVSRLYYDLVSLGENVLVKQEALRAATKLRQDDEEQENLGTLAPVELTRARSLESSSQFDLIQAQGLYKQQEIILRDQLMRTSSPVFTAQFSEIVPTDRIVVPETFDPMDVPSLVASGLANRPDLAQSKLQIEAGKVNAAASRNAALPQVNLYGNIETRGSTEQPYETLGSVGTGQPTTPTQLATGGLRVATIYQAGVQLTLPLRNRVAASDAARDQVELRQEQAKSEKLSQQVRAQIETAVVALETAQAAYKAAVASRDYQARLLDAEKDKLSVGQSTDLAVLQNQAFLAQAESTEIAARSDWMKARIELDHALGDLLEKNHIELDDAIKGQMR